MKRFPVPRSDSWSADPHHAAYEAYYMAARPKLLKYARWKTGQRELAEEFTQEVLLSAWKKWDMLLLWSDRHRDRYLKGAIDNQLKSWLEQQRRATELGNMVDPLLSNIETDELATRALIRRLIEDLPTDLREIVYLHAEGYSNAEIAKRLGIPESTARDHRKKAMNALAAALDPGEAGSSGKESSRDQR